MEVHTVSPVSGQSEKLEVGDGTFRFPQQWKKEGYSSFAGKPAITATGTPMPYGITQCYLPPGRGDIPASTPAKAGTRFSDPGGMQGWVGTVPFTSTLERFDMNVDEGTMFPGIPLHFNHWV